MWHSLVFSLPVRIPILGILQAYIVIMYRVAVQVEWIQIGKVRKTTTRGFSVIKKNSISKAPKIFNKSKLLNLELLNSAFPSIFFRHSVLGLYTTQGYLKVR